MHSFHHLFFGCKARYLHYRGKKPLLSTAHKCERIFSSQYEKYHCRYYINFINCSQNYLERVVKEISEYLNYREYLKDWVAHRKAEGLPGSNRWFALKMGINSTSWLSSILSGARNLNEINLKKLTSILNFSPYERSLFSALVAFNQSKDRIEKNRHFDTFRKIQARKEATPVSGQFYDYYKNWYNSAIRAVIGMMPVRDNYSELGALLTPPVSEQHTKEAVKLLEEIGFIRRNDLGIFELTHAGITTGEYEKSVAIRGFQEETIQLAKASLFRFDRSEKDISTLTLGISRDRIKDVKAILADTRRQIAELAESDDNADSAYQLNMQLFPLSKQLQDDQEK